MSARCAIEPMLVDYDVLAPLTERPPHLRAPRRRVPRSPLAEVSPSLPLWDDEVLERIARDRADALERDSVIRSLAEYAELLAEIDVIPADLVSTLSDGTDVFVAGRRMSRTREGAAILVTLQDGTGTCDVVFTPETLGAGELVLVAGVADGSAIRANESWDLRELLRRFRT